MCADKVEFKRIFFGQGHYPLIYHPTEVIYNYSIFSIIVRDMELKLRTAIVGCVAGALKELGARKNWAREGDTRGERKRLPERPMKIFFTFFMRVC